MPKHVPSFLLSTVAIWVICGASLSAQVLVSGHQVFVTSFEQIIVPNETGIGGQVHRAEGADWNCTLAAFQEGLVGEDWDDKEIIWRALVSNDTVGPRSRLAEFVSEESIYDMAGVRVSRDFEGLWDGGLDHGIQLDELGEDVGEEQLVWTGSNFLGGPADNCGGWLNEGVSGVTGLTGTRRLSWIRDSSVSCRTPARLYCIGPLAEFLAAFFPEDFNADGSVNFPDFLELVTVFGQPADGSNDIYDLDVSGTIDFPDFLQFAGAFGSEHNLVIATVAEPQLGAWYFAGVGLIVLRRLGLQSDQRSKTGWLYSAR